MPTQLRATTWPRPNELAGKSKIDYSDTPLSWSISELFWMKKWINKQDSTIHDDNRLLFSSHGHTSAVYVSFLHLCSIYLMPVFFKLNEPTFFVVDQSDFYYISRIEVPGLWIRSDGTRVTLSDKRLLKCWAPPLPPACQTQYAPYPFL